MRVLIVGYGEVGGAHARLLKGAGLDVRAFDTDLDKVPEEMRLPADWPKDWGRPDLMLCAMRYSPDYVEIVKRYATKFEARLVNVLSTVEPYTCKKIAAATGARVSHSTTRGLHPNLESGLLSIPKHVGGPGADLVADIFRRAGITCNVHRRAETTEVAHILNNAAYGVSLMFADEMARICREYGVDYVEAVMAYTASNNAGYMDLDHASKVRMILTPPNGRIGGHCVRQSAGLIPPEKRPPILNMLAHYNETAGGTLPIKIEVKP